MTSTVAALAAYVLVITGAFHGFILLMFMISALDANNYWKAVFFGALLLFTICAGAVLFNRLLA